MPFYQFNPFTGRLKESARTQPLYPISPVPLQKSEPPVMIYGTLHKPVQTGPAYQKAGAATMPHKISQAFKIFQSDLEKPVFLLAGKKDKLLFGVACVLVAAGCIQSTLYVSKETFK